MNNLKTLLCNFLLNLHIINSNSFEYNNHNIGNRMFNFREEIYLKIIELVNFEKLNFFFIKFFKDIF